MGLGFAHRESAGPVFGSFWNQTDPFLRSKPGPLAGYLDPLLTLLTADEIVIKLVKKDGMMMR